MPRASGARGPRASVALAARDTCQPGHARGRPSGALVACPAGPAARWCSRLVHLWRRAGWRARSRPAWRAGRQAHSRSAWRRGPAGAHSRSGGAGRQQRSHSRPGARAVGALAVGLARSAWRPSWRRARFARANRHRPWTFGRAPWSAPATTADRIAMSYLGSLGVRNPARAVLPGWT